MISLRKPTLLLAALALGLTCVMAAQPTRAASEVTVGVTMFTHHPNGISGNLFLPAGVTINETLTNVNAVVTRGSTSAGAVINIYPTDANGVTTFDGCIVGAGGLPNQGPIGAALTLFLP